MSIQVRHSPMQGPSGRGVVMRGSLNLFLISPTTLGHKKDIFALSRYLINPWKPSWICFRTLALNSAGITNQSWPYAQLDDICEYGHRSPARPAIMDGGDDCLGERVVLRSNPYLFDLGWYNWFVCNHYLNVWRQHILWSHRCFYSPPTPSAHTSQWVRLPPIMPESGMRLTSASTFGYRGNITQP